jgi:fermentation-respiration switch protein FrsA (DUF1100 family)
VDLLKANPLDALSSTTIPVLLIHGEDDINILPRHSRILVEANPAHAQLWLVPGAWHGGAASVAPAEFWDRVLGFLAHTDSGARVSASIRQRLCHASRSLIAALFGMTKLAAA